MAKGLRASSRKKNNAALRAKVFAPAIDARTERLSAKLQELAAKPKPERERPMEIDEPAEDKEEEHHTSEEMEVDAQGAKMKPVKRKSSKKTASGRIEKKVFRKKPRNSIVFAPNRAKEKRLASSRKNR